MSNSSRKPFISPGGSRPGDKPYTNSAGCLVTNTFHPCIDRYVFDFKRCTADDGWEQYDTDKDASYFGVWVRLETREIVTYAEGDITHVQAPSDKALQAELAGMADFYGPPPPAFRMLTRDGEAIEAVGARPGEKGQSGAELLAAALGSK